MKKMGLLQVVLEVEVALGALEDLAGMLMLEATLLLLAVKVEMPLNLIEAEKVGEVRLRSMGFQTDNSPMVLGYGIMAVAATVLLQLKILKNNQQLSISHSVRNLEFGSRQSPGIRRS